MDELGIERARYAGQDWGGVVAYLLGFGHPDRFTHLAGLAVPPPWREGRPPAILLLFLTYQTLVSSPAGALAMRRGLAKKLLARGRKNGPFSDEEMRIYQQIWDQPDHARASVHVYRTFLTKELPAIMRGAFDDRRLTVPTLVLMGGSDMLRKGLQPELYEQRADDIRTVVVDNAGHWLTEEQPDEVSRHLLDFFA